MKYKALVDIHYTPYPDDPTTWMRWRPGEIIDMGAVDVGGIPMNINHLIHKGAVEAIAEEVVDDEILE